MTFRQFDWDRCTYILDALSVVCQTGLWQECSESFSWKPKKKLFQKHSWPWQQVHAWSLVQSCPVVDQGNWSDELCELQIVKSQLWVWKQLLNIGKHGDITWPLWRTKPVLQDLCLHGHWYKPIWPRRTVTKLSQVRLKLSVQTGTVVRIMTEIVASCRGIIWRNCLLFRWMRLRPERGYFEVGWRQHMIFRPQIYHVCEGGSRSHQVSVHTTLSQRIENVLCLDKERRENQDEDFLGAKQVVLGSFCMPWFHWRLEKTHRHRIRHRLQFAGLDNVFFPIWKLKWWIWFLLGTQRGNLSFLGTQRGCLCQFPSNMWRFYVLTNYDSQKCFHPTGQRKLNNITLVSVAFLNLKALPTLQLTNGNWMICFGKPLRRFAGQKETDSKPVSAVCNWMRRMSGTSFLSVLKWAVFRTHICTFALPQNTETENITLHAHFIVLTIFADTSIWDSHAQKGTRDRQERHLLPGKWAHKMSDVLRDKHGISHNPIVTIELHLTPSCVRVIGTCGPARIGIVVSMEPALLFSLHHPAQPGVTLKRIPTQPYINLLRVV